MFELVEKLSPNAVIKVIGVGGGGGNAVAHMVHSNVDGVDFICANTDAQALKNSGAKLTLRTFKLTPALGSGAHGSAVPCASASNPVPDILTLSRSGAFQVPVTDP